MLLIYQTVENLKE